MAARFSSFGRLVFGQVLGEAYSLDDDEDHAVREVTHLWIYEGRYRVEVSPHVLLGVKCLEVGSRVGGSLRSEGTQVATGRDEPDVCGLP